MCGCGCVCGCANSSRAEQSSMKRDAKRVVNEREGIQWVGRYRYRYRLVYSRPIGGDWGKGGGCEDVRRRRSGRYVRCGAVRYIQSIDRER